MELIVMFVIYIYVDIIFITILIVWVIICMPRKTSSLRDWWTS